MLRIRVSFDSKSEVREAKKIVDRITKILEKYYDVEVNKRIYWNLRDKNEGKKDYGGRIYITLKPKIKS